MKALVIAVLAASVAACSTYGETQARPPMIELHTSATVDQYLGCVAPKFAEMWTVAVLPDGDAQVLTATGAGPEQILATVTVTPAGTGARVAYRQMHDRSWNAFGRMQEVVQACAST